MDSFIIAPSLFSSILFQPKNQIWSKPYPALERETESCGERNWSSHWVRQWRLTGSSRYSANPKLLRTCTTPIPRTSYPVLVAERVFRALKTWSRRLSTSPENPSPRRRNSPVVPDISGRPSLNRVLLQWAGLVRVCLLGLRDRRPLSFRRWRRCRRGTLRGMWWR